jgi:hypothetical protein
VWTPRRILLLFLGILAVGGVYFGYTYFLGHFDGLQTLPEGYRYTPGEKQVALVYKTPPTITLLQQAFGKNSPEGNDSKRYPNRIPIPGRDGVIACGAPQPNNTAWVRVSPVSVLLYSRPTLAPKPGETIEFSTFHGDEAMLQFDRKIEKIDEMSQAKVIAIELRSKPDVPDNADVNEPVDVRRGRIWVTNNRKSTNPADHIVFRLNGKLIVQLPDENTAYNPDTPHIWSEPADALVEMFDRQNMPYKLHEREAVYSELNTTLNTLTAVEELTQPNHPVPPLAALPTIEDLRKHDAIRDILNGNTLPPPTIVAHGLKIHLAPADKNPNTPAASKKGGSFGGVRQIILGEKVQVSLWTDGTSGFPGSEQKTTTQQSITGDPPRAFAAVFGAMHDANVVADRVDNRSLLLLTTPGLFKYDLEKGTATFDIAAHNRPGEDNFVVVSRLGAKNQTDDLICNKLVIEQQQDKKGDSNKSTGLKIKALTATGPQVILSVQAENLEASGTEIKYTRSEDEKTSVITLKGNSTVPVVAKRDGSKLTAGDAVTPAIVEITTTEGVLNGKPERFSLFSVLGPGRMDLVDRNGSTPGQSGLARWAKALRHEKQLVRKRLDPEKPGETDVMVDLLKFEENAAFVDASNGFNLRAEQSIWLWVSGGQAFSTQKQDNRGNTVTPAGANPERLVATGNVKLDSEDLGIRRNNKLTVVFTDVPTPKLPEPVKPAPLPALASTPLEQPRTLTPVIDLKAPVAPVVAPKPDVAKKPIPNPMKLESDTIETTLARFSVPVPAVPAEGKNPARPASTKKQYEMRYARCDDNVHVQQDPDPNDPKKPANGTDITGNKLILTSTGNNSSVMTVSGGKNEENWAKVSFEGTTIHGPTVEIDQPNNAVNVPGSGKLTVASGSNLTGQELSSPSDLSVTFEKSLNFQGAKAFAQFVGEVKARQIVLPDPVKPVAVAKPGAEQLPAPREAGSVNTTTNYSDLICHQMELTLDRPVYFNQLRGSDRSQREANSKPEDRPKLKAVVALPVTENTDKTPPSQLYVYYLERSLDAGNKQVKGRMLTAKQLDFANREKEQELFATGPGELRLLQPDNGEAAPLTNADPNKRTSGKQPVDEKAPLKLTLVKNWTKMVAKDQGNGMYQEAKFDVGARVLNAPADELTMTLEPHALPKGSMQLECDEQLIVSTSRKKKDGPAEQRLTAKGNAVYIDDNRTGLGDKITYDGIRVLLESEKRMASLSSNKKAVNQQQETRAKKFVYNSKTGDIDLTGSSGGSLLPDR